MGMEARLGIMTRHDFRTYHASDWRIMEDCRDCGETRRRIPGKPWSKYEPQCVTPAVDMSPAERRLEARGRE